MKDSRVRHEEVRKERDQLRTIYAEMIRERDSAQSGASKLRARITEMESETAVTTICVVDLAKAVRERDQNQVLLQSNATQVQGS